MLQDGGVLNAAFYHRRRRRPIDYTNIHCGTQTPRTYPHTFSKKILGHFPRAPALKTRATYPRIFSHLDSRFAEAVDAYLQRHPYNKTYYVTSTSYTSHKVSSLHYLLIFSNKKFSNIFLGPFPRPPGLKTPFSNSPSGVTYPRIFSHLSTSIYAYSDAVEPNLQRHPYTSHLPQHRGDQPVARPPYEVPILY